MYGMGKVAFIIVKTMLDPPICSSLCLEEDNWKGVSSFLQSLGFFYHLQETPSHLLQLTDCRSLFSFKNSKILPDLDLPWIENSLIGWAERVFTQSR